MQTMKIFAYAIVGIFVVVIVLLYILQTRLIFHPGKLSKNYRFKLGSIGEEVFFNTSDGEKINALFFRGTRPEVILYFHGNAGDLSGWQFVSEDFTDFGYGVLIVDYRGYGKSTGTISENGFYLDAEAAYYFLIHEKQTIPRNIIIYGRSIGSGVAVDLASKHKVKALILESPFTSLPVLANEKIPFFFPSFYLRFRFDNLKKIAKVKSPVILVHGAKDTLIPISHSEKLFKACAGKKELIIVPGGGHNDLNAFPEYQKFVTETLGALR